jgi:hypothetical protein
MLTLTVDAEDLSMDNTVETHLGGNPFSIKRLIMNDQLIESKAF